MRKEKLNRMENLVIKTLKEHGALGFRGLFEKASQPKQYYDRIGSMESLSKTLKSLIEKGLVQQSEITKKYRLTNNGEIMIGKLAVAELILSSTHMDSYQDWATWKEKPEEISSIYMFIEAEKNSEPAVIKVPHIRGKRREPWEFDILEVAEEMNLVKEEEMADMTKSKLKEMWNVLFGGTKRITLVETLNPHLLLEELLLKIEKGKEGVKP